MRLFLLILALSVVVALAPALAQEGATTPPPDLVGRISLADGTVSVRPADGLPWSDAEMNQPFAAGAAVRTGVRSRAEIEIGADTVDLTEKAEIRMVRLDDRIVQIALSQGRIEVVLRRHASGESVEIDFARGGVWLLQPGRYDIDAGDDGRPARIAVFEGAAHFAGGGADLAIAEGEAVDPTAATAGKATADAFADWCRSRDWDQAKSAALYYVSSEVTGLAELDIAGSWEQNLEYGPVWFPRRLPADWVPFREGMWRWAPPWGWTWLDDQPWGFAPSHYGRWALFGERWGWVPGRFVAHPAYAPAVVAFLGTAGVGLSYAEGNGPAIGWFPLAPGETYWPGYTGALDDIRALNRGNVADVAAIRLPQNGKPPVEFVGRPFANRLYASVVPRAVFAGGEATLPALLHLPEERLGNAPVVVASPVGPPSPPSPPAPIHAAAAAPAPKAARAAKPAQAGATRGHHEQTATPSHRVHLRAPEYAAAPRLRHRVTLRLAHAAHVPQHATAHKKDGKR